MSIELRAGRILLDAAPVLRAEGRTRSLPDAAAAVSLRRGGVDAAWPDGVRLRLRVASDGPRHVLRCSATSERPLRVDAVGVRLRHPAAGRICVDGYHSWDWSGVRDATVAGRGWWGAIWGTPGDGATVAIAAARVPRLGAIALEWDGGGALDVLTTGEPEQEPQRTGGARSLDGDLVAGARLDAEPVSTGPVDRRRSAGAGLPPPPVGGHRPGTRRVGWMSWNCLGPEVTAQDCADAAERLVPPGGVVLLDDGWMPWWGDWVEREEFDAGLADLAATLRERGRLLGVWVAPFLLDLRSAAAAGDAPLLRDRRGEPVVDRRPPSPQWVLDTTDPTARRRLAALGRRLGRAGAAVVKLDFLYAGALPGVRPPGWSGTAALRAGVAAVARGFRAAAPRGAAVWACGAPAAPLVGLVDACRSGGDSVVNIPNRGTEPPAPPWFLFGEATVRAQARNLAARSWLWGATLPPDADAITLGGLAGRPAGDPATVRAWLDVGVRSGGPLLVSDAPGRSLPAARLRSLRAAQAAVAGRPPRPRRPLDPLDTEPAPAEDDDFLDWAPSLPAAWE